MKRLKDTQKTSKTFFKKDGQKQKEKQEENRHKLNEDNVMLFDNMKEAKWRERGMQFMSMIDCINHKNSKERRRAELMSEMHNDIEALWSMQMRLRKTGASSDILVMLSRAREQISKERSKMIAVMRNF